MSNERRQAKTYNKPFYLIVTGVFAVISAVGLLFMLFQGLTEVRILITIFSVWYLIYMMDLVERRFQRESDNIIWRKFFQLRGKEPVSEDTSAESKPLQNHQLESH